MKPLTAKQILLCEWTKIESDLRGKGEELTEQDTREAALLELLAAHKYLTTTLGGPDKIPASLTRLISEFAEVVGLEKPSAMLVPDKTARRLNLGKSTDSHREATLRANAAYVFERLRNEGVSRRDGAKLVSDALCKAGHNETPGNVGKWWDRAVNGKEGDIIKQMYDSVRGNSSLQNYTTGELLRLLTGIFKSTPR